MSRTPVRSSPFDQVFDVVVVGSGHAGFAAAMTLRRKGHRVLLIGPRGDLVWESGRAFCPDAGHSDDPEWRRLAEGVGLRGGRSGEWLDGAITEVVATDLLLAGDADVLYYAAPVAVERDGDAVSALIVATKAGPRRVAGRQWIDATESGELVSLIGPAPLLRAPERTQAHLFLQHPDWSRAAGGSGLRPTSWPRERVLTIDVPPGDPAWRQRVLAALEELEEAIGAEIADVSMSHLSIEPISRYEVGAPASARTTAVVAANAVAAVPGLAECRVATLADRFALGVRAAEALDERTVHETPADVLARPLPEVTPVRTLRADVCVAGVGTGGALAALAAATTGASVIGVDPLAFVGGIGTGGGLHAYYFGAAGGLQQEVDRRTRALMKRFRGGPLGDGPFNPWAKMIVLEEALRERGVELRTGALLFGVERRGDRVVAALVATPRGVERVEAGGFVDGTGDGDLCALAGAAFTLGREHDGLTHAYSQSSGILRELHGRPRMDVVNFDAGFCDPTDTADLTRARLDGVRQYLLGAYDELTRPTYVAPALGLRQGPQVRTEYVLTLDDQIRRRRFEDPIGYTGAHYDCHSTDLEFESDEGMFWVWAARQWSTVLACELSYRMLVPRGTANVWIASRCLGVTQDAHYATRMQRDVQRVGEAAGFAAAEAVRRGETAQRLSYPALRARLDRTGAFDKEPARLHAEFGVVSGGLPVGAKELARPDEEASAAAALAALDRGAPGPGIWWLYRHRDLVHDAVTRRLARAQERPPIVGWLATAIAAMWHDPAAEPRLIEAVESLEYGFGEDFPVERFRGVAVVPDESSRVVPNWLCAVALLRRAGTADCLPAIERLIERPVHGVNTLTTVGITLERLVRRGVVVGEESRERVETMLDRLLTVGAVGALDEPGRYVGRRSERAVRGESDVPADADAITALPPGLRERMRNTYQDNTWQLHLAVARARAALGLASHDAAETYRHDERGLVRRAFRAVAADRRNADATPQS